MKKHLLQTLIIVFVLAVTVVGCSDNKADVKTSHSANNKSIEKFAGNPCNIKMGGVHFSQSINGADTLVKYDGEKIILRVSGKKDYFSDPDGKLSNNTSPILLSEIDNTKPFTISAKVTPEFTAAGTYNAGVLFLYANDGLWQKSCFEQSEGGEHRIVTVRTIKTSDDNNHDVVLQPFVYLKISSDTKTIGSYYSLDNKKWHMVRLYKNEYPAVFYAGISVQCPVEKTGSSAVFQDLAINQKSVQDFRSGN